jgi:site-specific DNA-methyltransferase (adenine-specific)
VTPYYADESVSLYHGDNAEILPELGVVADVCVTDPPYGETSLSWDRWPKGWPTLVAAALPPVTSLWCFGSLRMFLEQRDEFAGWRLAQDVVWEKQVGASAKGDRFMRVHEAAVQFYRGPWDALRKETPREITTDVRFERRPHSSSALHTSPLAARILVDDGTRLVRTVLRVNNLRGRALHPTEKPTGILDPLIVYSCPPGGTVLDPFAGSGSTLDTARCSGRKAVGIEASEAYCEVIARRLSQGSLFGGAA